MYVCYLFVYQHVLYVFRAPPPVRRGAGRSSPLLLGWHYLSKVRVILLLIIVVVIVIVMLIVILIVIMILIIIIVMIMIIMIIVILVIILTMALHVQRYLSNAASFVFYGVACLIRLIEFATFFATFEERLC